MAEKPTLHVVAGCLIRDGKVLLDQRKKDTHLADRWEFPGGKSEPGETDAEALKRELREELGIECRVDAEPLSQVVHPYEKFTVELVLYRVHSDDEPQALDVAAVQWFASDELSALSMPPADGPLVDATIALLGGK